MPSKPEKSLNFSPPITSKSSFSVIISKEGKICTTFSDWTALEPCFCLGLPTKQKSFKNVCAS